MPLPFPPRCAAKYRPGRLIASGGFGAVFEAVQLALDRPVVVKLLHAELTGEPEQLERFVNEARITATLSHGSIVRLLDHDVEDGRPWTVYELVDGRDLRQALATGPLKLTAVLDVGIQVAGALEEAHAHGVVHRDLKPENILDAGQRTYKVTDFGIARWSGQKLQTQEGMILGTPAYIAPEQLAGSVTASTDLYALGCVLFELATGSPPYVADNPIEQLEMHVRCPVPSARSRVPSLPAGLDQTLRGALEKDPAQRWKDAGAFRAALEEVAAGAASLGLHTLPAGTSAPARPMSDLAATLPTRRIEGASKPERSPLVGSAAAPRMPLAANAAAIAVLTCALALSAVAALSPTPKASPTPAEAPPAPELALQERADMVAELEALTAARWASVPHFQLTWDATPDVDPQDMLRKVDELIPTTTTGRDRAQKLVTALQTEGTPTPWRTVLLFRARCERLHREMQLHRLKAVRPAMARVKNVFEKTDLILWFNRYRAGVGEEAEVQRVLRAVDRALEALAADHGLSAEIGPTLEVLFGVAGQVGLVLSQHGREFARSTEPSLQRALAGPASDPHQLLRQATTMVWLVGCRGAAFLATHRALPAHLAKLRAALPSSGEKMAVLTESMRLKTEVTGRKPGSR